MSLSGEEEEGKRVERWKGAADAFEYDKSQTLHTRDHHDDDEIGYIDFYLDFVRT